MLCLSGSNSSVERAFSILRMMLSDKRLKSSHELLNYRLVIKGNHKYWTDSERTEILKRAVDIYMSKKARRKRKIDQNSGETSTPSSAEPIEVVELSDNETDFSESEGSGSENFFLMMT